MAPLKGLLESNHRITLPNYVCQTMSAKSCCSRMAIQTSREKNLKDDQGMTVFVVDGVSSEAVSIS